MSRVNRLPCLMQPLSRQITQFMTCLLVFGFVSYCHAADDARVVLPVENAEAKTEGEMKAYVEKIEHTDAKVEMVPIKGGEFLMGSPDGEEGRKENEGPQHKVNVPAFWMGKYEIRWDVFEVWMFDLDIQRRKLANVSETERDKAAAEYQLSQPTEPYTDMTFGMGKRRIPGDLHDSVCGSYVLSVAHGKDRSLLSTAHRSGMGVRLPRRHRHGLLVW